MEHRFTTLNNDMLMHVVRDLLSHTYSYKGKYYPPEDVVALLRQYAEILKPYEDELRELGWTRIQDFRKYILEDDEDGRSYISAWGGGWGEEAVRTLAEVADVFSDFPTEEALEEEIPKRVKWQRVENLQNALAYMSPSEQIECFNESIKARQRQIKIEGSFTSYESKDDPAG